MSFDFDKKSWIKVPPPYPPEALLCLAERTAAGLPTLSSINREHELNRARQIALQALGRAAFHAFASNVVYTQMRVTNAANLSRLLTSLNDDFLQSLAESTINESQLIKGKSETNTPVESRARLIGAFLGLLGAYCFAEMCGELETAFMTILTAAIKTRQPHVQDGIYELSDYKTVLQDLTQTRSNSRPVYELTQEEGPDHDKSFTVKVTAKSIGTAVGGGKSKKAAEQAAAKSLLQPLIKRDPSIIRKRVSSETGAIHKTTPKAGIFRLRRQEIPKEAAIKSLCGEDKLLHQALTHISVAGEFPIPDTTGLATLGDWLIRVYLTRKASQALWDQPTVNEIQLVLSVFYRDEVLARLFDAWNLQNWVMVGSAQTSQGCTLEMKETFVQALAGACYIDANNPEVALRRIDDRLHAHIEPTLKRLRDSSATVGTREHPADPKSLVQTLTQISGSPPEYKLVQQIGPAHNPEFKSGIRIKKSASNEVSPWLVGSFAPTIVKAEQIAASSFLGLAREWIKGGKPSALSLFRDRSPAAIRTVDQIAELLLQTILYADDKQQEFLQRTSLSLVGSMSDDLDVVLKRLAQVDEFIQTQATVSEISPRFISRAAIPRQTSAEIESVLGSLSNYLSELKPETWAETDKTRSVILEQLLGLPNLLKHLTESEDISDLAEECRQLIKLGCCTCNEKDITEPVLVRGMRGFLNWLLTEICNELNSESMIIRLFPSDLTLEVVVPNSEREPNSLQAFINLIVKCKDALLFGGGVQSCSLTDIGLRFVFLSSQNGLLVNYFLQEGRKQLSQLFEFGLALHDIKNSLAAIDLLWKQSVKDASRRYRCYAEIQETLQSLRGTTAALKLVSHSYSEPSKQTVNLNEFMDNYRQKAIHMLPPSIDFSTYGEHGSGDAWLQIDPDLMFYAFDNLLKNARETIQHRTAHIKLEWVIDTNTQAVLISISDTGPGMSEEVLERVLGGDYTSKSKSGGSGLGLRSARRIVEKHGGQLTINSKLGAGTQVNIELPLLKPDYQSPEPIADASLSAEEDKQV